MLYRSSIILLFISILLSSCSQRADYRLFQSKNPVLQERVLTDSSIEYKILPQDRLSITILKYPNISPIAKDRTGVLVDNLGNIHLPLVGSIKLSGLTQLEATKLVEKKYLKYLKSPSLYLEVINKRCYILGEVNKAGVIPMDKDRLTILEAIAFGGDLTDSAIRDNIIVISHNSNNNIVMRKIDLTNFDTLYKSNIIIKPNDIIYIQPNGWKEYKINADNLMIPFSTIATILAPFITVSYILR